MRILSTLTALTVAAGTCLALAQPAAATSPAKLFESNGCVACHGLGAKDAKKMGPNMADVAKKYTAKDLDKLAKKIRSGGKGSFGQVPMPPMAQVSEADAKELAKYALSFKGK